jgi:hypothetical protein
MRILGTIAAWWGAATLFSALAMAYNSFVDLWDLAPSDWASCAVIGCFLGLSALWAWTIFQLWADGRYDSGPY